MLSGAYCGMADNHNAVAQKKRAPTGDRPAEAPGQRAPSRAPTLLGSLLCVTGRWRRSDRGPATRHARSIVLPPPRGDHAGMGGGGGFVCSVGPPRLSGKAWSSIPKMRKVLYVIG